MHDLCCCFWTTCLPLVRDLQDLCCHLRTHCPQPVAAQKPSGPGLTAICLPLLRNPQDQWCRLGAHCLLQTAQGPPGPVASLWTLCSLPAAAQGPAGSVVLSCYPLPAAQGLEGPVFFRDPSFPLSASELGPSGPMVLSRFSVPLPAPQGPAGPEVSCRDPLPPACSCSGTPKPCGVV